MDNRPTPDALLREFRRERSIRRAVTVLEAKRKHIREELEQLIQHITLLIPLASVSPTTPNSRAELLQDALERLGDDAFAQLLLQILQDYGSFP
jgi:hypothetical protein